MHFRILKMIATSDFLTALVLTKYVFGRSSAPNSAGGTSSAPRPPNWFKRDPITSKGKGRGGERERLSP